MNNAGGPAFPGYKLDHAGREVPFTGMSLRDYFAAKAMMAFWMDPDVINCMRDPDAVARYAYEMADAMLVARSQT